MQTSHLSDEALGQMGHEFTPLGQKDEAAGSCQLTYH